MILFVALTFLFVVSSAPTDENTLSDGAGVPIDSGRNSITVGVSGPVLLNDQYLIERLAIQNRERIPERTVHARGTTAKGYFELTHDVSNFTFASLFNGVGKITPIALRFSTVIHSKGSPEFLRDPRGFAIKFYTTDGNYDIVGLNFPVFFIRDAIRFPEMIRCLKPNPVNGLQEWWRIWDWFSAYPESLHMFTHLLDDIGIPASYREMNGHGVHTYKWINSLGNEIYVRYFFQSEQGVRSLLDEEAILQPFSFATADLYTNIKNGNFPSWRVYYQILPIQPNYPDLTFDPLDTTKEWPFSKLPIRPLGRIVLNENVNNDFLENEQSAFSPGRMVPGIAPSADKMLQGRIFAYADTQRYRIGVNNQLLPINAPKNVHHNPYVDGSMNFLKTDSEINYFPSRYNEIHEAPPYPHDSQALSGVPVRQNIPLTDNFNQAGDRWRSFDANRQDRFARRVASTLTADRVLPDLREVWLGYWTQADPRLSELIRRYVNDILVEKDPEMIEHKKKVLAAASGTTHQ